MTKDQPTISNRQAFHDFYIEKAYEAGLQLHGNEVKSIREGKANLKGSFAKIDKGEIYIVGMHINPYKYSRDDYDPLRPRKLLLRKPEIRQIQIKLEMEGYTLVPLKVYFKRGYAKVEVALGKGKKLHDKRQTIKEKQAKREIDRAMRHRSK